jgi:hypothetical protein
MRDAIHIGAWVEVDGANDRNTKTVAARMVLFREDADRKLTGLGVIDQVISTAPDLVFAADGYRIRVTAATEVHYPKDVKSQADVHAGLWALYEGKLGQDGLLVAGKVRFVSTNHAKTKPGNTPANSSVPAATPQPPGNEGPAAKDNATTPNNATDETDTQVEFRGKDIEFGGTTYRISKDEALQSRVRRVGMSLVPVYQKRLPADDPSKIQFIFCAVDDPAREVLTSHETSDEGLILVPAKLAARFKNDDQLAAVLADGIAHSLQGAPMVIEMNRVALGEAGLAAMSFVPYVGPFAEIAESATGGVYQHEHDKALNEQHWRVALELMADAGYDPWQAPEAWRLAEPKKLLADASTLKYPDRSGYQFAILNLMYKKPVSINAAESGSTANTSASKKP